MTELTGKDVKAIFALLKVRMAENKERLISLDGATGDGDLGLTMSTGFAKAAEVLDASTETGPGKLFRIAGEAIANGAPSTMGTLVASGFMRAGKAIAAADRIGLPEMAQIFEAFAEGIMARGKAKVGEKTVLDVIYPAAQALKSASLDGGDLAGGLRLASEAAARGFEESKQLAALHGRAAYYGEQTIGKPDPGAAAGVLIVAAFADYVNGADS